MARGLQVGRNPAFALTTTRTSAFAFGRHDGTAKTEEVKGLADLQAEATSCP